VRNTPDYADRLAPMEKRSKRYLRRLRGKNRAARRKTPRRQDAPGAQNNRFASVIEAAMCKWVSITGSERILSPGEAETLARCRSNQPILEPRVAAQPLSGSSAIF
jgi:hypothetical protein